MQPASALRASREHAQVAAVDLAALAHPGRRGALVGDADLVVGVAEQAADDRRAQDAGAAGHEHTLHAGPEASGAVRGSCVQA